MKFYAHISNDGARYQTVKEHCHATADIASGVVKVCGLSNTAYLAGILHDMGKYSSQFQEYLEMAVRGEKVQRGMVNHTFAGVIYILERYHGELNDNMQLLTSEIIAYAIGAHHGLFDCFDYNEICGFYVRVSKEKDDIGYVEAKNRYCEECLSEIEIDDCFNKSVEEIGRFFSGIQNDASYKKVDKLFTIGVLTRLLLSSVMYGDRTNTIEFVQHKSIEYVEATPHLWEEQLLYLENKLKQMNDETDLAGEESLVDRKINEQRKQISEQCGRFAEKGDGIYKVAVPTGAGKTLATLRYALSLAFKNGKKHVILVTPLLSVLDQNSKVIADNIRNREMIGEYHSNIIVGTDNGEKLEEDQLLPEFWEEPIIITTLYQLLMNLFSDRTTYITRMQALINSVVVIDEAQSIPTRDTYIFNLTVNFLKEFCHTTIVLSSATQPCYEKIEHPLKLSDPCNIVENSRTLISVFKRVEICNQITERGMNIEEISSFVQKVATEVSSVLIVCNTRREAVQIYKQLMLMQMNQDYEIYHLSTSMCMAHRCFTLNNISASLKSNSRTICVSTQLVEAGVDFSFESVIRVMAGVDNLAQVAGRCNRGNEYRRLCKVYLVNLQNENLSHLKDIKLAQQSTRGLLKSFGVKPEKYDDSLLSENSILEYYERLFYQLQEEDMLSHNVKDSFGTKDTILNLLSTNSKSICRYKYFLKQAFKTAGENYHVFESETQDVIVPFDDKVRYKIAELTSQKASDDLHYARYLLKQLKPYTIQLWNYQLEQYATVYTKGRSTCFWVLSQQFYDTEIGLQIDNTII